MSASPDNSLLANSIIDADGKAKQNSDDELAPITITPNQTSAIEMEPDAESFSRPNKVSDSLILFRFPAYSHEQSGIL